MTDERADAPIQSAEVAWPSADVVYAELKERVALQLAQVDALDGKANFGLGSASLLTAGVAALRNAAAPDANQAPERWCILGWDVAALTLVNIVTGLAFAAFVAVVWCAYQAYRVRVFTVAPDPGEGARILIEKYLLLPEAETKVMLANNRRRRDLPENEAEIEKKVSWTTWSLRALTAEAVLLLIMALLQSFL